MFGTWIDGSILYENVFSINTGNYSSFGETYDGLELQKTIDLPSNVNVAFIKEAFVITNVTNGGTRILGNYYRDYSTSEASYVWQGTQVYMSSKKIRFNRFYDITASTNTTLNDKTAYFVVCYTKAS